MEYTAKTVTLKNGKTCLLRRGEETDAAMLVDYLKATAGETPYLLREPEEVQLTAEEERDFIRKKNSEDRTLNLLAFVEGEHAGNCAFNPVSEYSRARHRCTVSIALYRKFWGMGIGTALLGEILDMAKSAGYEQAELEVVSANAPAAALYRKFGFETTGTVPRAFRYGDGTYADFLFMVKTL